jgi:hypothetical protein
MPAVAEGVVDGDDADVAAVKGVCRRREKSQCVSLPSYLPTSLKMCKTGHFSG